MLRVPAPPADPRNLIRVIPAEGKGLEHSATIGEVDVQGVVPYAGIPLPPGLRVTPQGNQLQLSGSISAAGASVPAAPETPFPVREQRTGSREIICYKISFSLLNF